MVQHVHIDPAQVEAMIAKFETVIRQSIEEPGVRGTQARFNLAMKGAFARQMTAEINRGNDPETVGLGISAAFADMIGDFVASCELPLEVQFEQQIRFISWIASYLHQRSTGETKNAFLDRVAAIPAGRA